ncbi:16S rRNA (uracil(1498)-N(3))-methyltransferase, partial [bacterium]|nr:16S rRNA (uracil(1498)-N(3))-methyltransferase [bacterium]
FDDEENTLSQELGFQPVRLGPSILRVETAAIAIAAILGIGLESGQTDAGEVEE